VKNALQRDGLDPSIMDLDPEKSLTSQQNQEEELVDKGPKLKDDPTYQKYFKVCINYLKFCTAFLKSLIISVDTSNAHRLSYNCEDVKDGE
jgi:hypothetical protein